MENNNAVTITRAEWTEFECVRSGGKMNMMFHPNVGKFMTNDNYGKAKDHFQTQGKTDDLIIVGSK